MHSRSVAYQGHYFWDGRVQSLEQQALLPVVTPAELGNAWDVVLTYLSTGRHIPTGKEYPQAHAFYVAYFAEVFQGDITPATVSRALAAYKRTILTRDAAFDRWLAGDNAALTPAQKRGAELFFGRANCAVCHPPPLFTDDKFHNIGTPQAGFETPHLFPANTTLRAGGAAIAAREQRRQRGEKGRLAPYPSADGPSQEASGGGTTTCSYGCRLVISRECKNTSSAAL